GMNEDIASGPSAVASTSDTISVADGVAESRGLGAGVSARDAADARVWSWFAVTRGSSGRKGEQCTRLWRRSPRGWARTRGADRHADHAERQPARSTAPRADADTLVPAACSRGVS